MQRNSDNKTPKLVWDFPTRAFHWALVCGIGTSFISIEFGNMDLHFISGGTVLFLILFRLIWGFLGPETAQFFRFFPTPTRVQEWRTGNGIGHSPWGALSVFAMLGLIGAQASLGLFADDEIFTTGPLREMVSDRTAFAATSYHSIISTILLWLIALHIVAIAVYTFVKRSPLLRTFIRGTASEARKAIQPRPLMWIIVSIVIAALPVLWIFA